jgi:hypothetical protein
VRRSRRAWWGTRWRRAAAGVACSTAIGLLLAGLINSDRDSLLIFATDAAPDGSPLVSADADSSRLVIDPALLSKLQTLADGLNKEIVLCLTGTLDDGDGRATDFEMPAVHTSTPTSSSVDACPEGTIGVWHNHTPVGTALARIGRSWNGASQMSRRPELAAELCRLSDRDIETLSGSGYPFAVVSVDRDTWCWWSRHQIMQFASDPEYTGHPIVGQIRVSR